jgi:hypothetical protein
MDRILAKLGECVSISKQDSLDSIIVGEHGDDDIAAARFAWPVDDAGALCGQHLRLGASSIVDSESMAGLKEDSRHRAPHSAKTDKTYIHPVTMNVRHCSALTAINIQSAPSQQSIAGS